MYFSVPDTEYETELLANKKRINNQKVICTEHTIHKIHLYQNPEKKDYLLDTYFDIGKCSALAVQNPHHHYYLPKKDKHCYYVKVNALIAKDIETNTLEALIIGAVVA